MATQPKDFKKLQREWNKKLKDSGFNDIEQANGLLKRWDSHYFQLQFSQNHQGLTKEFQESKMAYYRMAGYFLNDYKFTDESEKLIWTMHAEGKGQRSIIKELKHRGLRGHFDFVGATIRRLVVEMKKRYQGG